MKAWRVYGAKDIRLDELESQPVGEGCVKLKLACSAISLTDNLIYEGKLSSERLPLVIGRQGTGMVTEVGENVTSIVRGDRVIVDPYGCCKTCSNCKSGRTNECDKMLTYGVDEDGFMRDFAVVSAKDVYKLPDKVKDSEAVFLEHIAMAINAISKLSLEKGEHIVIVGANVIGIILAQVAMYHQAVPILIDTRQESLDLAQKLGIYYTINSVKEDVQKKIFSLTGGRMAETIAHLSSSLMPLARTLEYVCKNGRAVLIGWTANSEDLVVSLLPLLSKQIILYGVNNGAKSISRAINMLANKTVVVEPMISREIEFVDVGKILEEMNQLPNKYFKVLVKT